MKRIHFFIIVAFAGILGTIITLVTALNWACMIAVMIFIPGIALSLEIYFKERREKNERLYAELKAKENAVIQFTSSFGIDHRRAEKLYFAGFSELGDFKNKTVEDLMQIDDINPTLAKRIINKTQNL